MSKLWRAPLAMSLGVALPALAVGPVSAAPTDCDLDGGFGPPVTAPWPQNRLGFQEVHDLATGEGITVAVIDSGIAARDGFTDGAAPNPQSSAIRTRDNRNVLGGFSPTDTRDCDGHGSMVASIIAAPRVDDVAFVGLAPDVVIVPIKAFHSRVDGLGTASDMAEAISYAVDAGADVINISMENDSGTARDILEPAMKHALKNDVVVVVASGNLTGDESNNPNYPAAFAADYPNVLSVGAVDESDTLWTASTPESVSVVAPGAAIVAPGAISLATNEASGYLNDEGTSFAAPFVSATAALVLERFPGMRAAQVVNRIKATADRPGVTVPDPNYGYGIVNPYLALTAVRDDSRVLPKAERPEPVAAVELPAPPDRTLQNIAYGAAAGLLGIAVIAVIGRLAWRRTAAERSRKAART